MSGIIKNFGTFWERSQVEWGDAEEGDDGCLLGAKRGRISREVDFAEQVGIYVLYEGPSIVAQRVTYVGQTGRGDGGLIERLEKHRHDHLRNRWQRFSWFGLYAVGQTGVLTRRKVAKTATARSVQDVMNHLEGVLVALMEPLLNERGSRFTGADEYLQVRLPRESGLDDLRAAVEDVRSDLDDVRSDLDDLGQ